MENILAFGRLLNHRASCDILSLSQHSRLLNSFAEEQAIEDTIYYLGEALRKEVIDIDVFLKVSF